MRCLIRGAMILVLCAAAVRAADEPAGMAARVGATPGAASATPAAAPNAAAAIRLWSSDIHDPKDKEATGIPAAISVVGARNGAFSGKVVVGAAQPLKGLRATVGDLKQGEAVIPADCLRVRCGTEWPAGFKGRFRPAGRDILLDRPPDEVPAGSIPVWLTIRVPRDARPGTYTGELTIEAQGLDAVRAPVKLEVQDWTLAAPQDYRTWVELIQSPDTLAAEYGVLLWSDRHWELVAQSLRLMSDTGCRIVHVPLICNTNLGNEQSMVRWIKKGDGQYEHDYAVMEKYLDQVARNLGQPKIIILYAWDVLLTTPSARYTDPKEDDSEWAKGEKARMRARVEQNRKGIPVTSLDPATGQVETIYLPLYADEASRALWQPVWQEVRRRMASRGLEKAMMLGMLSDWRPAPAEGTLLADLSGGLPWASCSHHLRSLVSGKTLGSYNEAALGLASIALDFEVNFNPERRRTYGWQLPYLRLHSWQVQRAYFNVSPLVTVRQQVECDITGGQRGVGRVGADFWPCLKNPEGRRTGIVTDRYLHAYWHSLNVGDFLLAPGPGGPAGTARLEVFREGLQECEARIAIESVLTSEAQCAKLGPELAQRAQQLLDDRQRGLRQSRGDGEFSVSGWQERTAKLFALAGEVVRKIEEK